MNLDFLPNEILEKIISFCDIKTVSHLSQINRKLNIISKSCYLWEYFLKRDYGYNEHLFPNSGLDESVKCKEKESYINIYKKEYYSMKYFTYMFRSKKDYMNQTWFHNYEKSLTYTIRLNRYDDFYELYPEAKKILFYLDHKKMAMEYMQKNES